MFNSILLTFVGSHDPYNTDGTDGPILCYIKSKRFNKIYLLYTNTEYLIRANEIYKIAKNLTDEITIDKINIENPVDYEEIFRKLTRKVFEIYNNNREYHPDYFILTDSGTPQMQTCWFLLVASNLFKAHLIQGIPPKFSGGIYKSREINLNFKDFPIILKPPEIDKLNRILKEGIASKNIEEGNLIGNETIFLHAKEKAFSVAKYDISVLLIGESGTGKELFARLIHENSNRKDKPFVSVNCSTINVQIAESELFGHKKGAFTGAIDDKEGFFGIANGGTIFLDEIGDLPLELQPKLLRVLENGIYFMVGDTKERKTDVRIIAATNRNLHKLVENGKFRRDLFERINQYTIYLPTLSERKNDIPLLINYFINEWNKKYKENKFIKEDVIPYLISYPWPGNVRELRNAVMSMCASSRKNEIDSYNLPPLIIEYFKKEKKDIPFPVEIPDEGLDLKNILYEIEKSYYKKALEIAKGNKANAARLLKINPHAFRKALKERFKEI